MGWINGRLPAARSDLYFEMDGEGPSIVLCHALGTSSRVWRDQTAALRRQFTVITFDLRGH